MKDNPYRSRLLTPRLESALRALPVVILTGARQTGKSTLARHVGGGKRKFYTLDDLEVLNRARSSPADFLRGGHPMTIDEAQRVPELLLEMKRSVVEIRRPGWFLLTGSANILTMSEIADSLAGRAVYLTLRPFTRGELEGEARAGRWSQLLSTDTEDWPSLLSGGTEADWVDAVGRGGFPVPALLMQHSSDREEWFAGYSQTYVERDLRDLSNISAIVDFHRVMRALALRVGGVLNAADLARDVALSQATVRRYIDLLDISYQVVRVPAYSVNRTKRLIKSPKVYWADPALCLRVAGEVEPRGVHLENLVLSDLLAWAGSTLDGAQVLHWRTTSGVEVDFVVEVRNGLLPIEVKTAPRVRYSDAAGLQAFLSEYPAMASAGLLLHCGTEMSWVAPRVLAAPWWSVL
jgi:hypothetical protein